MGRNVQKTSKNSLNEHLVVLCKRLLPNQHSPHRKARDEATKNITEIAQNTKSSHSQNPTHQKNTHQRQALLFRNAKSTNFVHLLQPSKHILAQKDCPHHQTGVQLHPGGILSQDCRQNAQGQENWEVRKVANLRSSQTAAFILTIKGKVGEGWARFNFEGARRRLWESENHEAQGFHPKFRGNHNFSNT